MPLSPCMRLREKICLITGGGNGIGAETARLFAAHGALVEIGDIDTAASQAVAEGILADGGDAHSSILDVSDRRSVYEWVRGIMVRRHRIDVLFNNAGISAVGRIDEVSDELWQKVLAINVTGVFNVSKAVLPHMMIARSGSVINMSSCIAEYGLARRAAYAATKGAILSMTRSMQVDYAPFNIRVNALLPGTVYTPFVRKYIDESSGDSEKILEELKKRQLGERLTSTTDVAYAALYLASDESANVMGSGLVVDAGINAGKKY